MTDTDEAVERAAKVHKLELDARGAACVCGWQSDEPFVDEAVDEYVAHALAAANGGEVERDEPQTDGGRWYLISEAIGNTTMTEADIDQCRVWVARFRSHLRAAKAENERLRAVADAAELMSDTLVELALACEVYFDTDAPLPDHDAIDGALVHAYRDQNNYRSRLAALHAYKEADGHR